MRWWCWWAAAAAAAAAAGRARARAGNWRQRRALGARCGGNQDLFNVSSNPGRGWKKNFFLEKSMEIFFSGRSEWETMDGRVFLGDLGGRFFLG